MNAKAVATGLATAAVALALDMAVFRAIVGPVPIDDLTLGGSAILLPGVIITAVVVAVAASPVGPDRADRWLVTRGLPADELLRRAASDWLQRTRTWRAIGFSLLLASGSSLGFLINVSGLQPGDHTRAQLLDLSTTWPLSNWPTAIAGYALGALLADLTRRSLRDSSGLRAAALQQRPVAAYLQPLSRWGPRVMAVIALTTAAVTRLSGREDEWAISAAGLTGIAVVGLIVSEAVLHGVVRRRQVAPDAATLAFDDAARATTVHAVAGSTIAIIGIPTADLLQVWPAHSSGSVSAVITALALLLGVGSFGVWLGHGVELAHRVRRLDIDAPA